MQPMAQARAERYGGNSWSAFLLRPDRGDRGIRIFDYQCFRALLSRQLRRLRFLGVIKSMAGMATPAPRSRRPARLLSCALSWLWPLRDRDGEVISMLVNDEAVRDELIYP